MTEYEMADIANAITSNILSSQSLYLTVLFAYLLVAYIAGNRLTSFQAGFVSFIFLFVSLAGTNGAYSMAQDALYLGSRISELRGEPPASLSAAPTTFIGIFGGRVVMSLGALYFMWQVRHPKIE
jgi:hypothetical protein